MRDVRGNKMESVKEALARIDDELSTAREKAVMRIDQLRTADSGIKQRRYSGGVMFWTDEIIRLQDARKELMEAA
jgi:hypothetical protein